MSSDAHRNIAKRYLVRGRVQGVGYRYFAQRAAKALSLTGWVRNLGDGSVEVYAAGEAGGLAELEASLWKGPPWSEVRGVDVQESALESSRDFRIRG